MLDSLDAGSNIGQRGTVNVDAIRVPIRKPNSDFVLCDLNYGLPFTDRSFENVFCSHVLEHIVTPYFLLDELLRVSAFYVEIGVRACQRRRLQSMES